MHSPISSSASVRRSSCRAIDCTPVDLMPRAFSPCIRVRLSGVLRARYMRGIRQAILGETGCRDSSGSAGARATFVTSQVLRGAMRL